MLLLRLKLFQQENSDDCIRSEDPFSRSSVDHDHFENRESDKNCESERGFDTQRAVQESVTSTMPNHKFRGDVIISETNAAKQSATFVRESFLLMCSHLGRLEHDVTTLLSSNAQLQSRLLKASVVSGRQQAFIIRRTAVAILLIVTAASALMYSFEKDA